VSRHRGAGDPGDHLFEKLRAAGFEAFDFEAGEDLRAWKQRQRSLGLQADGIPGQRTCQALRQAGHPHGLWTLARRDPG
jgi:murein L,D-transpeptidase YcbB/YkuD